MCRVTDIASSEGTAGLYKHLAEKPNVTLADGPSLLEGLVVYETDRYVCSDGFNAEAAELVCGELGFPAAEEYTAEALPRTVTPSKTGRLLCLGVPSRFQRLKDCSLTPDDCSSNAAVRLKCREPYGEIESEGKKSQTWTCPGQALHGSGQEVHLFNISAGNCVHPGHVPNGHWDSNMTRFGSKMTVTCGEGYSINGSATLQCVGLPGRSTYFPAWNVSVPFCWKFENATKGGTINTTPTQNTDYISSERLPSQELTTLPEITATSFIRDGKSTEDAIIRDTNETTRISEVPDSTERDDVIITMGTLMCVVPILLGILYMTLCKFHSKRRRSSQIPNQAHNRQLQMHPVDNSNQVLSLTDHVVLRNTSTDAVTEGNPFTNHHESGVMTHRENPYRIYQDAAEVDSGHSHASNLEQVSFYTAPLQSNVTCSVLPSVSFPYDHENRGLQDTSFDGTASGYDDCEYQDVDVCRKDCLTRRGSRSLDEAHLIDERCYNSLDFSKRSAQKIDINRDSEYDHCNRVFLDKRLQCSPTHLPASGPASQSEVHSDRNDDISYSYVDSIPTVNCEETFYYQLHPDEANSIETFKRPQFMDAFDSEEYSLPTPDKGSTYDKHPEKKDDILSDCNDSENFMGYVSNTRPCEELYATVNKTVGTYSAVKPATCEELYATVNKTVEAYSAAKPATCEELYATVNKTVEAYSAAKPAICEELYARVDKTKGGHSDSNETSHEELYMNVIDGSLNMLY
ncbi:uncharacterized protein [Diadema setosum]|uniref:uncharacterized protein n=1 Tax=Diadema setosum TaxID=31175 RepID=UPI003B3AABB7